MIEEFVLFKDIFRGDGRLINNFCEHIYIHLLLLFILQVYIFYYCFMSIVSPLNEN